MSTHPPQKCLSAEPKVGTSVRRLCCKGAEFQQHQQLLKSRKFYLAADAQGAPYSKDPLDDNADPFKAHRRRGPTLQASQTSSFHLNLTLQGSHSSTLHLNLTRFCHCVVTTTTQRIPPNVLRWS